MGDEHVVGGILCAGFGTRLHPLTESLPKPLLPFLNTPLLSYPLERLAAAGVERVGFNLHHLGEAIPPVADRLCAQFDLESAYAREAEILGTAGGIRGIWGALGEPDLTLIISNGDSITDVDLAEHLAAHRDSGARVTMVVRPKADDQPGRVWVDEEERMAGLRDFRRSDVREGSLREFDFTGVHIIEPEVLADVPLERGCIIGDVYGPLLEAGVGIGASVHEGFWAALDNPNLFWDTTRRVLEAPGRFAQAPLDAEEASGVHLAERGALPAEVEVRPPVLVGAGVEFRGEARIGPYAVLDGVEVADGAVVRRAAVNGAGHIEGHVEGRIAVADRAVQFGVKDED